MRTERVMRLGIGFVIAAGGLFSGGCATKAGTGALAGGAIGTGAGALVGAATGNPKTGAVVGGLLGTGVGTAVGAQADAEDQQNREIRQAEAVAAQAQQRRMGMTDVVHMVQAGHSEQVIINQIRSSGSTFQLSSADLDYLKASNVPDRVVIEMQNARAAAPVIVSPRPRGSGVVVYETAPPPVVFVGPPRPRPYFVVSGGHYHHHRHW